MTPEELQQSVVLITSTEPKNTNFGTGFVVKNQGVTTYLLTCFHVVKQVGGEDLVQAEGKKGIVIASGEEEGLDVAVIRVEGLEAKPSLKLEEGGKGQKDFITAGFQRSGKIYLRQPLEGKLGTAVGIQSESLGEILQGWDLQLSGENGLHPGYSGSPLVEKNSGEVMGMVTHRKGEKKGLALAIQEVKKIWQFVDSDQLYRILVKLGYRQQVRLFRKLIKKKQIAALLIYGEPEHGQEWLLHLLLKHHLSESQISPTSPLFIVLDRRGRSFGKDAFMRELHRYFGFFSVSPNQVTLLEIAKTAYQVWQTRDIIIVFDQVDKVGVEMAKKILENFWQPFVEAIISQESNLSQNKLFLFFIDYKGKSSEIAGLFQEKIEEIKERNNRLKLPLIREFTETELLNWAIDEKDLLPPKLVEEIDEEVEKIIEESEGGIPELTFDGICARCELNWFEESKKWMVY